MSDIVIELKRRNWSDIKIAREPDEVLRLSQVAELAEMFADKDFSEAWEPAGGELFNNAGEKMNNKNSENLDVVLLAKWLILLTTQKKSFITCSKLQVLLYYSQVWYLAFYRRSLFNDPLEAWMHGPAVFKVYKHFESRSFLNLPYQKELPEIPARIQKHFCEILEVYLPFPTEELKKMVKNEFPWQNARRGLQEQESSRKTIAIQDIMDFYSEKKDMIFPS